MSYVVLARRWRPQKFADVIGQDVVVKTLQNAIGSNSLAHAYLFTGIRGVGKTTMARLLAMAVNCEHGSAMEPCGECPACTGIASGSNLDVLEMDAASHTGVDDIRDILEAVRYPPVSLKTKVYIIDEAHMLSKQAFNALLKTLEEPPERILFILATTEAEKLPVTVRSRCQRFDLQRIGVDAVGAYLSRILNVEKVEHEAEAVAEIARAADGSIRDALSLAERVLAFSGKQLTSHDVRQCLGMVEEDLLRAFSDAIFRGDAKAAVDHLRISMRHGHASRAFLQAVGELWHQLACLLIDEGLLEFEPDQEQMTWLRDRSKDWDVQELDLRYQILLAGLRDLSLMDERRGAEMLAIRLAALDSLNPHHQQQDEKGSAGSGSSETEPTSKTDGHVALEPAPQPPSIHASDDSDLPLGTPAPGDAFSNWAEVVQSYASIKPGVSAMLEHVLCLDFGSKVRLALDAHQQRTLAGSERLAFTEWLGREVYWEPREEQEGESLADVWEKQSGEIRRQLWDTARSDPRIDMLSKGLNASLVEVHPPGALEESEESCMKLSGEKT